MNRLIHQLLIFAVFAALIAAPTFAADPIRVLIVDGQNNHDLEKTTPWLKSQLESTGLFAVDVSSTPPARPRARRNQPAPVLTAVQEQMLRRGWEAWRPNFSAYDVVLLNYNGEDWPTPVNDAFEKFVADGGGVVVVHAGNNPFAGWEEFDKMIGLGWRDADYGDGIYFDDAGNIVRRKPGEGPGAGHGLKHEYQIIVRDTSHPITAGMPIKWMHEYDELYHGQRGPAQNMHILASAFADPNGPGGERSTGAHEPLVWWIPYGKGRVFTNLLGHVARNDQDLRAMRCVGFLTLLKRGTEWAATGKVTQPIPPNFPTAGKVSLVPE